MLESFETRFAPALFLAANPGGARLGSSRDANADGRVRGGADLIFFPVVLSGPAVSSGIVHLNLGARAIAHALTTKGAGSNKLALGADHHSRVFSASARVGKS